MVTTAATFFGAALLNSGTAKMPTPRLRRNSRRVCIAEKVNISETSLQARTRIHSWRMHESHSGQIEFGFGGAGKEGDGYSAWIRERNEAMSAMARHLGLPLGHQVEVWLK